MLAGAAALAGCSGRPASGSGGEAGQSAQETGYLAPPMPDIVRADAAGLVLSGRGPPGGRVRLAEPTGQAVLAPVDAQGRWTIPLGRATEPRIYGLSVTVGGRTAQALGYVVVTPQGQAAVLRAGASAVRVDGAPAPGFRSVDFDAGGGVEVACAAPPKATVILTFDGHELPPARADDTGRYVASLPAAGQPPIRPGPHQLTMIGDGFADRLSFSTAPAQPLAQGPLRSQLTPAGLRLDWMTPAGGLQSTLLAH